MNLAVNSGTLEMRKPRASVWRGRGRICCHCHAGLGHLLPWRRKLRA